jgi:hypothetical protein
VFAEPDVPGPFRVGAAFVEAWGAELDTDIRPRERQGGAFAEISSPVGPVDATVYGEYAERHFPGLDGRGYRGTPGHGGFVAGEVTWDRATLSAEHRDFFRFEHDYHDPPTTLRQHTWTQLNRVNGQVLSDIPDDDVNGTLVQAEYVPDLFTSFGASYSRLDRGDNGDRFFEAYGEAKSHFLHDRLAVSAAGAESGFEFGNRFEERLSGFGELIVELDERNSLSVGVEWTETQESNETTQAFEFPL